MPVEKAKSYMRNLERAHCKVCGRTFSAYAQSKVKYTRITCFRDTNVSRCNRHQYPKTSKNRCQNAYLSYRRHCARASGGWRQLIQHRKMAYHKIRYILVTHARSERLRFPSIFPPAYQCCARMDFPVFSEIFPEG